MSGENKRSSDSPGGIPPKPTKEAALEHGRRGRLPTDAREPSGLDQPAELGTERQEVGDRESSGKHPPYVTRQETEAEVQDELPSPSNVPVLPANASGKDKLTPNEQREPIDDRSMYEGRPERDKDRPPSERAD